MDPDKMMEGVELEGEGKVSHARGKRMKKAFDHFIEEHTEVDEAMLVYLDPGGEAVGVADHTHSEKGHVIHRVVHAAMNWLMKNSPDVTGP